jgi:hypothetical protein
LIRSMEHAMHEVERPLIKRETFTGFAANSAVVPMTVRSLSSRRSMSRSGTVSWAGRRCW